MFYLNAFRRVLVIVLIFCSQALGQSTHSINTIPDYFSTMEIDAERGSFWWLYPFNNGARVSDLEGNFAVGAGGYLFDFPTTGLRYNNGIFNTTIRTTDVLNYRKILHQEQFGLRQSELLVQTDGDIYRINTETGSGSPRFTSLLPDSLKGIRAAAFLGFNSGVVVDKNNRIYRTLNGGESWERRGFAPTGGIRNLTITSVEDIFISYFSGALQYSTDGGNSFRIAANNNEVFSNISFATDNFALATSSFRFYKTEDRGASWTELTTVPLGRPNHIVAITDSVWLVSTDSTVYRTENAGQTYSALTSACPEGRITKFSFTRSRFSLDAIAALVNGNLVEFSLSFGTRTWRESGYRSYSRERAFSDNTDIKQLYVSDSIFSPFSNNKTINLLTSESAVISSGFFLTANYSTSNIKFWAKNSNGTIYINKTDHKIYGSTVSEKAYPTVTDILLKNNKIYFVKPGNNYLYSLFTTNLSAIPDSVPLATQGNLVGLDAIPDVNSFEIYLLGSDGKVIEYNIGTGQSRIINFPYPVEPIKLKLSKKLLNTPLFIGVVDNRGRLFAGATTSNTLTELNGTLTTSFRDFAIAGDSLFAINTDNVFFVTNISNPNNVVWEKDSIDISRTLTQIHIGNYRVSDTAIGARPGRVAISNFESYFPNALPSILITGTGPCMISTNPSDWHSPLTTRLIKRVLPLVIYPNPSKNRNFKVSVENPEWVIVTDLTGKVVAQFNNPDIDAVYQLSANLSGGIYIVQAKTNKGISTGKLIVQ